MDPRQAVEVRERLLDPTDPERAGEQEAEAIIAKAAEEAMAIFE